jgi:uncharacterized protein YcnI
MTARLMAGAALATALLLPATASAHVTLQPATAVAGADTVETVSVPNEFDDAVTTKVAVQMPPGFDEVSYEDVPGWRVTLAHRGGDVARITWTAADKADAIQPGQFRDFPLAVGIPDKPGSLTFKALQTYSNGKVVRWIGPEGSDEPAPVVQVAKAAAATPAARTVVKKEGGGKGLAIVALALAAASLAIALSGRMRARQADG